MTIEEFEELVKTALVNLPERFKEKLDNVQVVVEEWPRFQLVRGRLLLGLYQGIPKLKRGSGYTMVLPDKITIFKGPIELISRGNTQRLKDLVVDTIRHEIAHHFGISDSRLEELSR